MPLDIAKAFAAISFIHDTVSALSVIVDAQYQYYWGKYVDDLSRVVANTTLQWANTALNLWHKATSAVRSIT